MVVGILFMCHQKYVAPCINRAIRVKHFVIKHLVIFFIWDLFRMQCQRYFTNNYTILKSRKLCRWRKYKTFECSVKCHLRPIIMFSLHIFVHLDICIDKRESMEIIKLTKVQNIDILVEQNNLYSINSHNYITNISPRLPSKYDTLKQCCFKVGPASKTLGQR